MVPNITKLNAAIEAMAWGTHDDCLTDSDIKEILLNNSTDDFAEAYYEVDLAKRIKNPNDASEVFREGDLYAQVGILESFKDDMDAIECYSSNIECVKDVFVLEALLGLVESEKGIKRIAAMFNNGEFDPFKEVVRFYLITHSYHESSKGHFVPDSVIFPNTDPRGLSGGISPKKLQFGDE